MLITLLLMIGAATPDSATIVVTRRTTVPAPEALALCNEVSRALKAKGLRVSVEPEAAARTLARLGVEDTSKCQGRVECIVEFGRQLGVENVVSMSISDLEGERSVVLQLYRVSTRAVLATGTLLFRVAKSYSSQDLAAFATQARAALMGTPPGPDSPLVRPEPGAIVPAPPPMAAGPAAAAQPPMSEQPPPQLTVRKSGPLAAWLVGGLGAAALVTAGVLGISGQLARGRLEAAVQGNRSSLTGSEADQLVRSANAHFTASGVALFVGVGLGATAVVLW